jgi:hypothetical protein
LNNSNSLSVGVIYWQRHDGSARMILDTLEELGFKTKNFLFDDKLPENLDVVYCYGPLGSLVPLGNQLQTCPPSRRPSLILSMTEQFFNPRLPERLVYPISVMRSWVERKSYREVAPGKWKPDPLLTWITKKAYRYRYYGDLYWLRQQGILSVLAVGSDWMADFLRERGFDPLLAHGGFHPAYGDDLHLERDIPVLWIGKIAK